MPDQCSSAFGGQPNLWVEVSVAGAPVGRTKIGAVPYSIEANDAALLQGNTAAALAVPSGLIAMFGGASCPTGWTLCNGSGGTPNLVGSYVKGGTAVAAAAGQNTHAHTLSLSTAAGGSHYHIAMFDWTGSGNVYGHFFPYQGDASVVSPAGAGPWTATSHLVVAGTGGLDSTADNGGMLTTTTADHTHSVSGSTSTVSHEPAHVTLLFCMKN
jgi:hypothetical protein